MTTETLMRLLEGSHLLTPELMTKVRRGLDRAGRSVSATRVAKTLVDGGHITAWQARQLLAGRNAFYLGRYRLLDRLGKGGMGVVFRAQHAVMDRQVALKVMSRHLLNKPSAVARFNREVRTAAALNHPNIITAYDADCVGATHFLVMEYAQGQDLNQWLRVKGPFPAAAACECARQVAEGLIHATRQGMVHRDIKPVNLLLTWNDETDRPVVKILDMGLARFASETQEEDGLTRLGQTIGTPDYIAPEAAENFKNADVRADIFSLGCALFKLLTGKLPFAGSTTMEKLMARASRDAIPLRQLRPELSPELEAIVAKMLSRDPAARYQTPGEVAAALAEVASTAEAAAFFREGLPADTDDAAAAIEADADSSLIEFFRDFSVSPLRDEPGANERSELGFAEEGRHADPAMASRLEQEADLVEPLEEEEAPAIAAARSLAGSSNKSGMSDLLDDEFLDDPLLEQAAGTSTATSRRRLGGQRANWDSKLMLIGGGVLLVLLMVGGGLLFAISRQSGDEALAQAQSDYDSGSYSQAISKFGQFLEEFPKHPDASRARVNRGLAQMRQAIDAGGDWSENLTLSTKTLTQIAPEPYFAHATGELVALLPRLAKGLATEARQQQSQTLLDQTAESLELIDKYIPQSRRPGPQLAEIDDILAYTRREMSRDAALEKAITEINAAVASGELASAYQLRGQLLREYPELETREELIEAVRTISLAHKDAVTVSQDTLVALTEEPATEVAATILATDGQAIDGVSPTGVPALAVVDDTLYALDSGNGDLLWRQYVGPQQGQVPQELSDEAAGGILFVDTNRNELTCRQRDDGSLRWRLPLPSPTDTVPLVSRQTAWTALRDGTLLKVALPEGDSPQQIHLPQALEVGPATNSAGRLLYQPGDHSNLYVLDSTSGECQQVVYLGHDPGSIQVSPLAVSRYVIVAENSGNARGRLRVLTANEQGLELQETQQVQLDGHVITEPVLTSRNLHLITDRGTWYSFEIAAAEDGQPLKSIVEQSISDSAPMARYPLLEGGDLWVGDNELTKYQISASRGRLVARWVKRRGEVHLQPLKADGETLIQVARAADQPGAIASAVRMSDGETVWQRRLAVPVAGDASAADDPNSARVLSAAGALFELAAVPESGSAVLNSATARAEVAGGLATDGQLAPLTTGAWAFTASSPQRQILLGKTPSTTDSLSWLVLPYKLTAPPIPLAGGLAVPADMGQVALLDIESGVELAAPFQPLIDVEQPPLWRGTATIDGTELIVTDGQTALHRVGMRSEPVKHLAPLSSARLQVPLSTPLAVGPRYCYAGTEQGELVAFDTAELQPAGNWPIEGGIAAGPVHVGEAVYVLGHDQALHCFSDAAQRLWSQRYEAGAPVGWPVATEAGLFINLTNGQVVQLNPADGTVAQTFQVGEPLTGSPIPLPAQRLLVTTPDGALLVINTPQP